MLTGTGQSRMWEAGLLPKGGSARALCTGPWASKLSMNFCQNWWSKEIHLISATGS